jgi:hypothetical protein
MGLCRYINLFKMKSHLISLPKGFGTKGQDLSYPIETEHHQTGGEECGKKLPVRHLF